MMPSPHDQTVAVIVPQTVAAQRRAVSILGQTTVALTAAEYEHISGIFGLLPSITHQSYLPWKEVHICDDDQVEFRRVQLRLRGFQVYILPPLKENT